MTDRTSHRRRWGLLFGLLAIAVLMVVIWINVVGQPQSAAKPSLLAQLDVASARVAPDAAAETAIAAFCGDCYGLPRAECFPRDRWHYEVREGYKFYIRSGRDDLQPPPFEQTLAYYRSRAPVQVKYPQPKDAPNKLGTEFRVTPFPADPENPFPPEFSNFCWSRLAPETPPRLLACEMRLGLVAAVDLRQDAPLPSPLARLHNPTHVETCDLDGDGDQDVLYTNGDAFDNNYVDPSHGVQWLENKGKMQFDYHRVTDLSGAYRALAADVDLDGDQDIIAVAYLPPKSLPPNFNELHHASILCLEQLRPGVFARHTLETDRPYYATLQVADFDADGDPDFVVGPGPNIRHQSGGSPWLTVWWNQKTRPK